MILHDKKRKIFFVSVTIVEKLDIVCTTTCFKEDR